MCLMIKYIYSIIFSASNLFTCCNVGFPHCLVSYCMKESITLTSSQSSGYRRIWYMLQDSSAWLIFFSIWGLYVVVSFLQQRLVFTEEVVYNTFSEQLAYDRIEQLLQARKDWEWLGYALTPVFIFLQVFFTTICLNIGYLLSDYRGSKLGFRQFFGISIKASIFYPLYSVVMLLVCLFFLDIANMKDYSDADFFSLAGLLNLGRVEEWWVMPLRAINLFELFVWLALAAGISKAMNRYYGGALSFVALSYGTGFLLWILFVMFLQLSLSA